MLENNCFLATHKINVSCQRLLDEEEFCGKNVRKSHYTQMRRAFIYSFLEKKDEM